jgi:hypothetical protein
LWRRPTFGRLRLQARHLRLRSEARALWSVVGIVQALIIVGGYGSDVARVGNLWNHARGIFWAASIMYLFFFATQITVFVKGTTESGAPAVVNLFVRSPVAR